MNNKDRETLKLVAGIFGNVAAIAMGIAFFEKNPMTIFAAIAFGVMAVITIRSIE